MADHLIPPRSVMIVAGEASGDMHASRVIRALRARDPALRIFGIGGDQMQAEGMELLYHIREVAFLGVVEVLRHYPFIRTVFRRCVRLLREEKPDVLMLVDYPGFNLRLARVARRMGIRIVYYISPQVWAWGASRIRKMVKRIDQFAVILPFEEKLFRERGIPTRFVGHPLLEIIDTSGTRAEFLARHGLPDRPILALLPGSRMQEISALLPALARAAAAAAEETGCQPVIAGAPNIERETYASLLPPGASIPLVRGDTHRLLRHARAAFVASGTATLEAALCETPMVIVYRTNPVTFHLARLVVKVKHLGIVNILAGKSIAPELLQKDFTKERLLSEIRPLLGDESRRKEMIAELRNLKNLLGAPGASERVAKIVYTGRMDG